MVDTRDPLASRAERSEAPGLPALSAASYYERVGETSYVSTRATESPWQSDLQHGGPPAALLARAIVASLADEPMVVGKIEVDFLGPIPQGRCAIGVEVLRPGRQVRQVQALMSFADVSERPAVAARAWLFAAEEGRSERLGAHHGASPLPPAQPQVFFDGVAPAWGYGPSIEWRFAGGSFAAPGAAEVWARVRVPLVADEPTADLERMLVVADSTNGISAALPMRDWLSIPPALTVGVLRPPAGEWFLVEASTAIESRGTGLAESVISDDRGMCARVLQPLLVAPRPPGT